ERSTRTRPEAATLADVAPPSRRGRDHPAQLDSCVRRVRARLASRSGAVRLLVRRLERAGCDPRGAGAGPVATAAARATGRAVEPRLPAGGGDCLADCIRRARSTLLARAVAAG